MPSIYSRLVNGGLCGVMIIAKLTSNLTSPCGCHIIDHSVFPYNHARTNPMAGNGQDIRVCSVCEPLRARDNCNISSCRTFTLAGIHVHYTNSNRNTMMRISYSLLLTDIHVRVHSQSQAYTYPCTARYMYTNRHT